MRHPAIDHVTVSDSTAVDEVNRAVLAGSLVIVLLAALSQLITCVDQTYERRRQLATLAVFGVRRRTLAAAVLWQTAVPLLAGLALAVPAALATTYLLLTVIDTGNPGGCEPHPSCHGHRSG